jgi:hypothetical protein
MLGTIVVGVVVGGLATLARRWHRTLPIWRNGPTREQLAARVVYEEMIAAISAIDLALRDDESRWLLSLSESTTLTEAWRDYGDVLLGLDLERWEVLIDAMSAVPPSYGLTSIDTRSDDLKSALATRRERLVDGAEILRVVAH